MLTRCRVYREPYLKESNPIACRLYTSNLALGLPYTALSYMWGDPEPTHTIIINGHDFLVRKNLFDFLVRVRNIRHRRRLWIDAIFIQQDSIGERNHQVAIMGDSYFDATIIISWLGIACQSCPLSDNNAHAHRPRASPKDSVGYPQIGFDIGAHTDNPLHESCPEYRPHYDQYWGRVWIIQEVVLARSLLVWFDQKEIHDESLTYRLDPNLVSSPAYLILEHRAKFQGQYMAVTRRNKQSDPSTMLRELASLMISTWRAECSDTHDRLFAIMSLIPPDDKCKLNIKADYSKDTLEIIRDVEQKLYDFAHSQHIEDYSAIQQILILLRDAWGLQVDNDNDCTGQDRWLVKHK